jgi:hypothetical protein|tara:strand:- start:1056 stop:1445 length:390 start_codon:yes stop_codon:yes gene_type:complete
MNPFDFVNDINFGKKDIMTDSDNPELAESTYNPFLTNRALSYFPDTIQFANMMNKSSHIDNMLQYSFLLNIIRKRKRFSKWFKKNDDDVLQMVIDYYGYSVNKAKEALKILNDEQIEFIREKLIKGGMK